MFYQQISFPIGLLESAMRKLDYMQPEAISAMHQL